MKNRVTWPLFTISIFLCAATFTSGASDILVAQSAPTDKALPQTEVRPKVEVNGESRSTVSDAELRINCPAKIQVEIDDSITGRDWPSTPVAAKYVRAEAGYVSRSSPTWAICIYTAYGGEFKIKKLLDRPYETCREFSQQGGRGGLLCK